MAFLALSFWNRRRVQLFISQPSRLKSSRSLTLPFSSRDERYAAALSQRVQHALFVSGNIHFCRKPDKAGGGREVLSDINPAREQTSSAAGIALGG